MFTQELVWSPPESVPFEKLREVADLLGVPPHIGVRSITLNATEMIVERLVRDGDSIVAYDGELAITQTRIPVVR